MSRNHLTRKQWILVIGLALLCFPALKNTAIAQSEEPNSRQIVLDRFNKARPAEDVTAGIGGTRVSGGAAVKAPLYRRTGPVR
ncbi:MAG: hypothetical protein QOE96_2117, partial [Blastocatellia bacterium]|nr:hypothetical protein [Blastocatellia bacterium]